MSDLIWTSHKCLKCGWTPTSTDQAAARAEVEAHALQHIAERAPADCADDLDTLRAALARLAELEAAAGREDK
jgi:hypothetical protein